MRKVILALLALLFFGTATQAQAYTYTDGCKDWNVGAAKFAPTAAISMQKLHGWLQEAVKEQKITADEAPIIEQYVRDHMDGTPATITMHQHFAFMATSELGKSIVSDLCYNPDYNPARTKDGNSISYTALTALQWVIKLPTRTLLFTRFFVCYNWAGEWVVVSPPAPPSLSVNCLELHVTVPPGDHELHTGLAARRQLTSVCRGAHGNGRTLSCDKCVFTDAVDDLRAKGYLLAVEPNNTFRFKCNDLVNGCEIILQEPLSAAQRTDDDIILFCLSGPNEVVETDTKDIHWYSFVSVNGGTAKAYIGPAPTEWLAAGGVYREWKWLN